MAKNIMPDIAKLLGVEINEDFELRIAEQPLIKCSGMFCITKNNIVARKNNGDIWQPLISDSIYDLFNGTLEVVRKPFEPKNNEQYWSYAFYSQENDWQVVWTNWRDSLADYMRLKLGLCFRTEEEAKRERARLYKEITGREWQDK